MDYGSWNAAHCFIVTMFSIRNPGSTDSDERMQMRELEKKKEALIRSPNVPDLCATRPELSGTR